MTKLYTVKQASKILGFSTNTIYKFLKNGRLKANRGNAQQGRFRIPHESLEKFLGAPLPETLPTKPTPHPAPQSSIIPKRIQAPLPLKFTRLLIILSLIFILIDTFTNPHFSLAQQALRLTLVFIFILIAYQFGGTKYHETTSN